MHTEEEGAKNFVAQRLFAPGAGARSSGAAASLGVFSGLSPVMMPSARTSGESIRTAQQHPAVYALSHPRSASPSPSRAVREPSTFSYAASPESRMQTGQTTTPSSP